MDVALHAFFRFFYTTDGDPFTVIPMPGGGDAVIIHETKEFITDTTEIGIGRLAAARVCIRRLGQHIQQNLLAVQWMDAGVRADEILSGGTDENRPGEGGGDIVRIEPA